MGQLDLQVQLVQHLVESPVLGLDVGNALSVVQAVTQLVYLHLATQDQVCLHAHPCLSVCLSVCLPVCLSVCLSTYVSLYVFNRRATTIHPQQTYAKPPKRGTSTIL